MRLWTWYSKIFILVLAACVTACFSTQSQTAASPQQPQTSASEDTIPSPHKANIEQEKREAANLIKQNTEFGCFFRETDINSVKLSFCESSDGVMIRFSQNQNYAAQLKENASDSIKSAVEIDDGKVLEEKIGKNEQGKETTGLIISYISVANSAEKKKMMRSGDYVACVGWFDDNKLYYAYSSSMRHALAFRETFLNHQKRIKKAF